MQQVPLFPLNTVLFPNMPITLHIFEPRYKLMIEQCIQSGDPFGVVLIREGQEALGPLADPYPIGCTAQIADVERLPDGHMNIVAIGLERFEIHALSHDKPYLVGSVETLPIDVSDSGVLREAGRRLRPWVERYLTILAEASGTTDFDLTDLPTDPLALGYLAAAVAQVPNAQKQELLGVNRADTLLAEAQSLYRRELALLSAIVERDRQPAEEQGLFSLN
jgi:Lon protease-like protein